MDRYCMKIWHLYIFIYLFIYIYLSIFLFVPDMLPTKDTLSSPLAQSENPNQNQNNNNNNNNNNNETNARERSVTVVAQKLAYSHSVRERISLLSIRGYITVNEN